MQRKLQWIAPLLILTMAAGLFSGLQFWQSGRSLAWFGAFLGSAALPIYMMIFVAVGGAARTSPRLMIVQTVTIVGVALAAYGAFGDYQSRGLLALPPLIPAVFGLIVLQWYVFICSIYGRKKSKSIVLGQPLPELVFRTLAGVQITSRDFVGSKTLVVFFRGNWCPLCMAQLRELRKRADRLAAASVQVKFVSNQNVEKSKELAGRLDLPGNFEVLHDRDLRAARKLSIEDVGGTPPGLRDYPADTVMATVIALDAKGRVVFGDETDNYRVRPHPDKFLPLLEA